METQPPSQKVGVAPQFSAHICSGEIAGWIKMPLGMGVGLGPGDFVLDKDPAPLPKRGVEPPSQFSAHFYCGQMVGCIKMPHGMEVGLSPGDFVLDGDPAPSPKGGGAPNFWPCLLWPNGWMDQDGTWHGGGPWSRPHCVRWGPSCPPQKRGQSPQFWPISIVVKRLNASRCHLVWR